jgi:hypothetical protein
VDEDIVNRQANLRKNALAARKSSRSFKLGASEDEKREG